MARSSLILVMALAVLMGCQSKPSLPEFVDQVQEATVKICKYVPTAWTVTTIFLSATDYATTIRTVSGMASAICLAVTENSATLSLTGEAKPTVNGIVIEGHFVGD